MAVILHGAQLEIDNESGEQVHKVLYQTYCGFEKVIQNLDQGSKLQTVCSIFGDDKGDNYRSLKPTFQNTVPLFLVPFSLFNFFFFISTLQYVLISDQKKIEILVGSTNCKLGGIKGGHTNWFK
jgi:hypothetical protein